MNTNDKSRFVTDDGKNATPRTNGVKKGMFVTDDGQNVLVTFLLLILLFGDSATG
jgi:hypothetical protein